LEEIFSLGDNLGYVGVLITTLIISLIVFVPIPYIPVLVIALLSGKFDPNLLALSSAIGVTLGRTIVFLASYRGRSLIKKKTLTISKFTPWKFIVTTFFGKLIVNLAVVWILLIWGKPLALQILSRTSDPVYLALIAIVSVSLVGCLLYFMTRLDWVSIIGKRFPWTLRGHGVDDNDSNGEAKI
jgi:membrane protein DedA with SNARE-associated domain